MSINIQVINKIKTILKGKGINTIRQLGKSFRGFNSFEKNRMDRDEFHVALKENGVLLSKQQSDLLLNSLDKRDGTIDVQEFLTYIRGYPNQARIDVIHQTFKKFDVDNQGYVLVEDLRGIYNPINHPKVIRGELTADQVFLEFLQNFTYANKSGVIYQDEWFDYYAAVSADIELDENFVILAKETWRIQ